VGLISKMIIFWSVTLIIQCLVPLEVQARPGNKVTDLLVDLKLTAILRLMNNEVPASGPGSIANIGLHLQQAGGVVDFGRLGQPGWLDTHVETSSIAPAWKEARRMLTEQDVAAILQFYPQLIEQWLAKDPVLAASFNYIGSGLPQRVLNQLCNAAVCRFAFMASTIIGAPSLPPSVNSNYLSPYNLQRAYAVLGLRNFLSVIYPCATILSQ
jgi:hypothetical protein